MNRYLSYFIVFLGAGFGGIIRYWSTGIISGFLPVTFPYGTLTVNVVGSFIIGFVMYFLHANAMISPEMRLLLTTGFCGGLTTFSTFSFETINLLKDNEYYYAGLNIISNVVLTLLAVVAAYKISKLITGV